MQVSRRMRLPGQLKKALAERALSAEMDHHQAGETGAGNSRVLRGVVRRAEECLGLPLRARQPVPGGYRVASPDGGGGSGSGIQCVGLAVSLAPLQAVSQCPPLQPLQWTAMTSCRTAWPTLSGM